jgi:hypothetical protein
MKHKVGLALRLPKENIEQISSRLIDWHYIFILVWYSLFFTIFFAQIVQVRIIASFFALNHDGGWLSTTAAGLRRTCSQPEHESVSSYQPGEGDFRLSFPIDQAKVIPLCGSPKINDVKRGAEGCGGRLCLSHYKSPIKSREPRVTVLSVRSFNFLHYISHQRTDFWPDLKRKTLMVSYQMYTAKEAHRLISLQASSGADRHSDDVPALQNKISDLLVFYPAKLPFHGGSCWHSPQEALDWTVSSDSDSSTSTGPTDRQEGGSSGKSTSSFTELSFLISSQ